MKHLRQVAASGDLPSTGERLLLARKADLIDCHEGTTAYPNPGLKTGLCGLFP